MQAQGEGNKGGEEKGDKKEKGDIVHRNLSDRTSSDISSLLPPAISARAPAEAGLKGYESFDDEEF